MNRRTAPAAPIPEQITIPLLLTKLLIPPLGAGHVPRPSLVARLQEGHLRGHRLALLAAPAGSGKTTLLAEWLRASESPAAWLSLDEGDNDPIRFAAYLVAAVQRIKPRIGRGVLAALQTAQPPPLTSLLPALINDLAEEPGSLVLALDDAHLLHAPAVHDAISFLIDHLPAGGVQLAISTRASLPLPLARLRARGQLTELRGADLRFSPTHATAFVRRSTQQTWPDSEIARLVERTEGWIAGLQIATQAMHGLPPEQVAPALRAFGGAQRDVVDYMWNEVLSRQPEEVRAFALQTSILDRLTAPLCEAVTGQGGGQEMLERLERANLFIHPLDERRRWYRYHALFSAVLRRQLDLWRPGLAPALHRRASAWYASRAREQREALAPAIEHALQAEDETGAARLLDRFGTEMWGRGEHATLRRWLDSLPPDRVRAYPRLSVLYGLALFEAGRQEDAQARLQDAQEALADPPHRPQQHALWGMLCAARAFVSFHHRDLLPVIRLSRQALDDLPPDSLTWRGSAAYTLGLALRLSQNLPRAEQALAASVANSLRGGAVYTALLARLNLAVVRVLQGRLRRASEILRRSLELARERGLLSLPIAGLLYAELGSVLTQQNRVEEALPLLEQGVGLIEQGGDVNALARAYAFVAYARCAAGDLAGALDLAGRAQEMAQSADVLASAVSWVTPLRMRIWIAQGDLRAAKSLAARRGLDPDGVPSPLDEADYIALARLVIALQQPEQAQPLLSRILRAAQASGRVGREIEVLALQALALQARGAAESALAPLARALELAGPEGMVRPFLNEGPAMRALLDLAVRSGVAPAYARPFLDAFAPDQGAAPSPPPVPLLEPLTGREIEVLRLLATDLSVNDIAARLSVARSTVRSHIKRAYAKLDVHSRVEAVLRAQQLGML